MSCDSMRMLGGTRTMTAMMMIVIMVRVMAAMMIVIMIVITVTRMAMVMVTCNRSTRAFRGVCWACMYVHQGRISTNGHVYRGLMDWSWHIPAHYMYQDWCIHTDPVYVCLYMPLLCSSARCTCHLPSSMMGYVAMARSPRISSSRMNSCSSSSFSAHSPCGPSPSTAMAIGGDGGGTTAC